MNNLLERAKKAIISASRYYDEGATAESYAKAALSAICPLPHEKKLRTITLANLIMKDAHLQTQPTGNHFQNYQRPTMDNKQKQRRRDWLFLLWLLGQINGPRKKTYPHLQRYFEGKMKGVKS